MYGVLFKKMKFSNVGIDIEDISSFKNFKDNKSFYLKVFSKEEIKYCLSRKNYKQHFAGKFAAKEAVVKAFPKPYALSDIGILNKKNGQPYVMIKNKKRNDVLVSISHSQTIAVAIVLVISH